MNRQKEVIKNFNNDRNKVLTKKYLYDNVSFSYFLNWEKHFGELLSRMIKNNSLERVERGKYKLGSGKKSVIETENENQTKLF